jgi:hypothetical protein
VQNFGRVFPISPTNKMRRVLVFLDECPVCGRSRALIKNIEFDGSIHTVVNRTGSQAIELLDRYSECNTGLHKTHTGSKENMNWLWFDGFIDDWVRDFNGTKIFRYSAKCFNKTDLG